MLKKAIKYLLILAFAYFISVVGKNYLIDYYEQQATYSLMFNCDCKKAIHYYDKLIWWQPLDGSLYRNRGDAYKCLGQYTKAISDYKKALEIDNFDWRQTTLRIALAAKKNNDLLTEELALLNLLKLSKNVRCSEFGWANYYLGRLEYKRGNFRKAINYYGSASGTFPCRIYHRANAYYALGKIDSARLDLKLSLKFIKKYFVSSQPNSFIAQCDTCSFPFGSKEYESLTETDDPCQSITQTLEEIKKKTQ